MDQDSNMPPGKAGPKKPRVIEVKIGGQPSRKMTPDQAADYLKNIASKGAFGGAREMKLTFGKGGTATASVGPATSSKLPGPSFLPPTSSKRKDPSMPCSEKEMKALMSMFVEIMGLQMNTDKLNKPRKSSKNIFKFPDDLPPPPGGWPEIWPHDNDDDSVDSVPELMDFDASLYRREHPHLMSATGVVRVRVAEGPEVEPEPVTGMEGIVPLEWDSLERMAIEDALEQEERARKHSTKAKDSKKSWKKEKARKEAQAKVQEELAKKREKNIAGWKTRVASSMQSLDQLEEVLSVSPLRKEDKSELRKEHMDALLHLCVPKNRAVIEKGRDVRERLVSFILDLSPTSILTKLRSGRSLFHTACFYGDYRLVRMMISKCPASVKKELSTMMCLDSGFTPSHYAVLSASFATVEELLNSSFPFSAMSNDTHTWRASNGKGFTPRQLLESLVQQNQKEIESHGMALPELTKTCLSGSPSRLFVALLERLARRLEDVDRKGYVALSSEQIAQEEELAREASVDGQESICPSREDEDHDSVAVGDQSDSSVPEEEDESLSESAPPTTEAESQASGAVRAWQQERPLTANDPLVASLLQMGFDQNQVIQGIEACGGIQGATPDEVVAWIFGQDNSAGQVESASDDFTTNKDDRKPAGKAKRTRKPQNKKLAEAKRAEALKKAEEERLAAECLAAKREEQRRRNREWNTRTQERQLHEVQTQISKAGLGQTPALLTGLDMVPSSPKVTRPSTTENSHGPSLGQSVTNDASTIGSIVEIHVEANDDQTVSTLGSWQQHSRPPPLPIHPYGQARASTQPILPPGLDAMAALPPQPAGLEGMGRDLFPSTGGFVRPPGILEPQAFMHHQSMAVDGNGGDLRQPSLATGHESFGGVSGYPYHSHVDPRSLRPPSASIPIMSSGPGDFRRPGLGTMPHMTQDVLPFNPPARSPIPAPSPLDFSMGAQQRNHTESSFVDSISTGAAMLNDVDLWGDGRSGAVGSSLLGNVIQSNSNLRGGAGVIGGGGSAGVIGGGINRESSVPQNPFGTRDGSIW